MLEVKEISKNFGEFKAIDKLSFNVKIGDVMGFWVQMELEKQLR